LIHRDPRFSVASQRRDGCRRRWAPRAVFRVGHRARRRHADAERAS
jgi:hypothetical protein